MIHVYILRSLASPDHYYKGISDDVEKRLAHHNAGSSPHTAKYRPWEMIGKRLRYLSAT